MFFAIEQGDCLEIWALNQWCKGWHISLIQQELILAGDLVVVAVAVVRSEKDKMLSHGFSVGSGKPIKTEGWFLVLGVTGWMGMASHWARGGSGKRRMGEVKSVLDRFYPKCLLNVWVGILRYYSRQELLEI